jgi:hypothetical protein
MEIDNIIALGVFKGMRDRDVYLLENASLSYPMTIYLRKESCPTEVKPLILIIDTNQWVSIQLRIPLGIHRDFGLIGIIGKHSVRTFITREPVMSRKAVEIYTTHVHHAIKMRRPTAKVIVNIVEIKCNLQVTSISITF